MSSRKIWSIPIAALALVLMLAGAMAVTGIVQAQTPPSAPTEIEVASDNDSGETVKVYEIIDFDATAHAQTGTVTITDTVAASGDAAAFTAAFAAADTTATTSPDNKNRVTVSSGSSDLDRAQGIYEITVNVPFDSDITTDAADDGDPATTWDGDSNAANDEDLVLSTALTVYVPGVVDNTLTFTVDSPNVIIGDVLSTIGRDLEDDPQTFVIANLGSAEPRVAPDSDVERLTFELIGNELIGYEVLVRAAQNFLGDFDDDNEATIWVDRGDHNLDGVDSEFSLQKLEADVNDVGSLRFQTLDDTDITPGDDGIHYTTVIFEDTEFGESVLPYNVGGVQRDEQVTGLIDDGASAGLFRVNNDKMAIEYAGSTGGLTVGDEHVLRLTATGDSGLKNRVTVGMVKITVANVDDPPAGVPADMDVEVVENVDGPGLVEAETLVHDFAGVGSDPEGLPLTYSLGLLGDNQDQVDTIFAFDGTELVTIAEIGDGTETFERTVIVSDGVIANNQEIAVEITVDVNDPVMGITDAADLPMGVTYNATDDVYEVAVSEVATIDDEDVVLLDLSSIVMGSGDSGDDVTYTLAIDPAPSSNDIEISGSQVSLGDVPEPAGDVVFAFTVMVDDGYNNAADGSVDATLNVAITVTVEEAPAPEALIVDIVVTENTQVCNVQNDDDTLADCTLAGLITDAVTYGVENFVDGGDNYAVASDGAITVVTAPNHEDGENPGLIVMAENADEDVVGRIAVRIVIEDVNEAPTFSSQPATGWAPEEGEPNRNVKMSDAIDAGNLMVVAMDEDAQDTGAKYSIMDSSAPFAISASGVITVSGELDYDDPNMANPYVITVVAEDVRDESLTAEHTVSITIGDLNDSPVFIEPDGAEAALKGDDAVDEDHTYADGAILEFAATDADKDSLEFEIRVGASETRFELGEVVAVKDANGENTGEYRGKLFVRRGPNGETDYRPLDYDAADYDTQLGHRINIDVDDSRGGVRSLRVDVLLNNVNDNAPEFDSAPAMTLSVLENTARGFVLANYSATDADGQDVTYSLSGPDAKSFMISDTGDLMTLESLDADGQVPCGPAGCLVTVVATDVENDSVIERGAQKSSTATVRISVTDEEDSVSTLSVSKANPVPGTTMGDPMSALAGTKETMVGQSAVMERPGDLPATMGDAPMNFVETEWANWGTVLRIEITAESPDEDCGNGNQCVVLTVTSDSADDKLKLAAYRSSTQENLFVAAVMLVEKDEHASNYALDDEGDEIVTGIYRHQRVRGAKIGTTQGDSDLMVPRLRTDEEDEVEIEFGNLRDDVEVENEAPEVSNFAPEHERAFSDADVDYTFTITDDHSGLPEPEDLPDNDGDSDYTPVVALISKSSGGVGQCSVSDTGSAPKDSDAVLSVAAHIHEDDVLYCPGRAQDGEYIASEGGFGFAPIRDDKDFNEIDNGYDVETTIVLTNNDTYYVTFIVCDNAGNCAYYDPDGNDDDEELAEITVDINPPLFVEARTGLNWDSTDNEYDDDRNYIQVIFDDLTALNPATVETDDFVVEGHTVVSVTVYENPDDEDVDWADSGRYAEGGDINDRQMNEYRDLENAVFLELADELLADETPDVTIVPNGVEDWAGKEQDEGDLEADDWISPKFTIVSITSTLETAQDEVLAGDGDEVTVVVTSDERLDQTRPTVTVTYVNAPSGSVDTKGTASCRDDGDPDTDNEDDWTGKRDRGEIVNGNDCLDGGQAEGDELNNSVEKVSNTEWIVTITEPKDTGYYNFYISGKDRSPQENVGSEGVRPRDRDNPNDPGKIVTDFFDSDGDVNVDDAVFWEADINLAKPNVRVSGDEITDNEPDIEYRSPLFVEIDFTVDHTDNCRSTDTDYLSANCMNENSEYAEDNFDDVVITMFELDGVDMTDSVKTTDDQTFLVSLENVSLGDHTAKIQAMDVAGNTLEDVLEIDFEVSDREPFENRLNPGWNLVSLPGEPADSAIGSVFGPGVEVRTVYTYDPVVPGGWMVAVRETLDSDWQGDLTEITGSRGYWVLSDAIQDWEVSIPRLAGGAAGTGTPIQPPVIPLYAGWNLIPVTDISGNGEGGDTISADVYLQNLDDGLDLARVLGFDTIMNQWFTVLDKQMGSPGDLEIGSGYWVFVREAASLVPSGIASDNGDGD